MGSGRALAAHLDGKSVVICVGAGGVGKTTTSAAIALGLARSGRKVAVVTIDPARRLATALGLDRLSDVPHRIKDAPAGDGELWAMMLDPKRALDDAIARLAPDEKSRGEIMSNPIYRELSGAVAGSQELSAIVKLYELHEEHDFDVLVLDTPPSRNALDFLEAPARLLGFLEGRALQIFLAPSGLTARLFGRGSAILFAIFARVTGVDLLSDLSAFFASMSTVLDGFGERTRRVEELLREPSTAFVIVTSPESEPAREAVFLAQRLREAQMSAPQLVVNRYQHEVLDGLGEDELRELLAGQLSDALAARVSRSAGATELLARRDRRAVEDLADQIPGEPLLVPQLAREVQDLDAVAEISALLFDAP